MNCTRCEGTGFLNIHQLPNEILKLDGTEWIEVVMKWINENDEHDVQVCDCCGDGENWYGEPGEHDENDYGYEGPYAYNGGLPECW